ncbi:MAG: SGNH/GDSL hydrolase family protein [Ferruginibacter sp.]
MKKIFFAFVFFAFCNNISAKDRSKFYAPSNSLFQYNGRIDFSNPERPTMWASATAINFSFKGKECKAIITDEKLYGTSHNYVDIIVDGKYKHIQLKDKKNEIVIGENLSDKIYHVTIYKSSEAIIGYIQFEGIYCNKLIKSQAEPTRKIEFFGDSITSGMGDDTTNMGCHKGQWYDNTNAYKTYGAITARALDAQYYLTSVSGIGLMHSCCDMDVIMPQVYDKISLRENKIPWDFSKYQPDVVSVCLSQNDGLQDSAKFCSAYVKFLGELRMHYPGAVIFCLSSPMADAALFAQTKKYLPSVLNAIGDKNIHSFFFTGQFTAGCDSHPSGSQHAEIAKQLTAYIKAVMRW